LTGEAIIVDIIMAVAMANSSSRRNLALLCDIFAYRSFNTAQYSLDPIAFQ